MSPNYKEKRETVVGALGAPLGDISKNLQQVHKQKTYLLKGYIYTAQEEEEAPMFSSAGGLFGRYILR